MAPAFGSALVLGFIVFTCAESCLAFRIRDAHPTPVGPVTITGNQGNVKLPDDVARPKKSVFGRVSSRGSFVANDSQDEDDFDDDVDELVEVEVEDDDNDELLSDKNKESIKEISKKPSKEFNVQKRKQKEDEERQKVIKEDPEKKKKAEGNRKKDTEKQKKEEERSQKELEKQKNEEKDKKKRQQGEKVESEKAQKLKEQKDKEEKEKDKKRKELEEKAELQRVKKLKEQKEKEEKEKDKKRRELEEKLEAEKIQKLKEKKEKEEKDKKRKELEEKLEAERIQKLKEQKERGEKEKEEKDRKRKELEEKLEAERIQKLKEQEEREEKEKKRKELEEKSEAERIQKLKQEAETKRLQLEEERKRKEKEEEQERIKQALYEVEMRRNAKAEQERIRAIAIEAERVKQLKREEEEKKKRELEVEKWTKQYEEEQRKRRLEEEEFQKRLQEEVRQRKILEEERKRKVLEEEQRRQKLEEEERKKKELEEEQRKKKLEEDERKKKEKEKNDKFLEEEKLKNKKIEDEKKRKFLEEEHKRLKEKLKEDESKKKTKGNKKSKDAGKKGAEDKTSKKQDNVKLDGKEKSKVNASTASQSAATKTSKPANFSSPDDSKLEITDGEPGIINAGSESQKTRAPDAPMSLAELNEEILSIPSFVPNFSAVEDPVCQQHGKIFLRQLRAYKLWALQMLDSSAKVPSGLLRGNVNQLGDFDECLGVLTRVKLEEKVVKVQGQYCLATLDFRASHPAMKLPVNLMQSRALIRGTMRDPGHFIPRFTTANWGICLPASCSALDARRSIEAALENFNTTIGIKFKVGVDENMCYVKEKAITYSKETLGVIYFYAIFICVILVATLRDWYFSSPKKAGNYSERIIMAFSLKRTLGSLFSHGESGSGDIGCIHGIRSLSTIALFVAHKLIPISRVPFANRIALTEAANNPLSSVLRASLFYTDSFLLLSGVLTSYNMAKELERRGEIRWFCRFITRFIRLTPALLAVIFWYAFVMEHIGSGPQWNSVVKANADICKENAWTNLLYIQNFFPFEEMCATHTHQLALDMQLSIIAPMLVFFLQMKPVAGIIIVFFLLQLSATLRYYSSITNNLSLVIFHGMTVKQLYNTANSTYILPLHRATPYLFGVGLGVVLRHIGKDIKINKILLVIGWLIALALGSWPMISPWRLAKRDYVYNLDDATRYSVLSPVLSAMAICWVIFVCFTGNCGVINKFLSSHLMVVLSRLSYAIYLSQFAVFFYNVGSTRHSSEFSISRAIDLQEVSVVLLASTLITITFDIPMQEVRNIIMESTDVLLIKKSLSDKKLHDGKSGDSDKKSDSIHKEQDPGERAWDRGKFTSTAGINGSVNYSNSNYNFDDRPDLRRPTMLRSNAYETWERSAQSRPFNSNLHPNDNREVSDADYYYLRDKYFPRSYSTSPNREFSNYRHRYLPNEQDYRGRYNSYTRNDDFSRPPTSSVPRFAEQQQRSMSSEPDDYYFRNNENKGLEEEMQLRRRRFLDDKFSSQERERVPVVPEETEYFNVARRSSAEGKLALLREPITAKNMELWTVSKLQSSQEPDEDEDPESYQHHRRSFRESEPLHEDAEENSPAVVNGHGTNTVNGKIIVQDLKKTGQNHEASSNKLDVKNLVGLFKRESIIKSQASEEDPEYLIPERPKLVEQEQEHPLKTAWQLQKSKSEEDGSSPFALKDTKVQDDGKIKEKPPTPLENTENTNVAVDVTVVLQNNNNNSDSVAPESPEEKQKRNAELENWIVEGENKQ